MQSPCLRAERSPAKTTVGRYVTAELDRPILKEHEMNRGLRQVSNPITSLHWQFSVWSWSNWASDPSKEAPFEGVRKQPFFDPKTGICGHLISEWKIGSLHRLNTKKFEGRPKHNSETTKKTTFGRPTPGLHCSSFASLLFFHRTGHKSRWGSNSWPLGRCRCTLHGCIRTSAGPQVELHRSCAFTGLRLHDPFARRALVPKSGKGRA